MNHAALERMSRFVGIGTIALATSLACSSSKSHAPPAGSPSEAGGSANGADGGGTGGGGSQLDGSNGVGGNGAGADGGVAGNTSKGGNSGSGNQKDGSATLRDGSNPNGGNGGNGGTSGTGDGGTSNGGGSTGTGGALGGYSCPSDSPDASEPTINSVCSASSTWGAGVAVPVDTGVYDQLVAVTPDELTLVKSTSAATRTFSVADRTAADVPFGTPQTVDAYSIVAISPDGLRLVSLSADGKAFQEITRSDRASTFGTPSDGAFATLNADAATKTFVFLAAVIASDDHTLYYTASQGNVGDYPIHVSTRTDSGPWPVGAALQQCELETHVSSQDPVPTGVSADGLTLFFLDGARGIARAAFAKTAGGPFVRFVDLGARLEAQPNAACDRLYYSPTSGTSPLVVAPAK